MDTARSRSLDAHTPTPWEVRTLPTVIWAEGGTLIVGECSARGDEITETDKANAQLVVRAVNNHQKLIDALELILPLAKGYRPEGQSDTARATCKSWVAAAEEALAQANEVSGPYNSTPHKESGI